MKESSTTTTVKIKGQRTMVVVVERRPLGPVKNMKKFLKKKMVAI